MLSDMSNWTDGIPSYEGADDFQLSNAMQNWIQTWNHEDESAMRSHASHYIKVLEYHLKESYSAGGIMSRGKGLPQWRALMMEGPIYPWR